MKQSKRSLVLTLCALVTGLVWSQRTLAGESPTQEGINRVQSNLENSKTNMESYKQNLSIVVGNIETINKAKTNVLSKQDEVKKQADVDQSRIADLKGKSAELQGLLKTEKDNQTKETEQIAALEKNLALLKQNQIKREQVLQSYTEQMKIVDQETQKSQQHLDTLRGTAKELARHQQEIEKQQGDWMNKKKGYDAEVARWQQEMERNQKLKENFSALANQE